jgi:hypothetical protein
MVVIRAVFLQTRVNALRVFISGRIEAELRLYESAGRKILAA